MKKINPEFLIIALLVLSDTAAVSAGGVVMKQRSGGAQKNKQQQQIQIERQRQLIIQQQQQEIQQLKEEVKPEDIKDIVDIADILKSLETSSRAWELMIDAEAKEMVIQHFIDTFKQQNALIRKPARTYVPMIDGMAAGQPEMLENPFENILRLTAIMEYDFDVGQDKDELAKKILGEKAYIENKKRLSKSSSD